jgi:hypothetical protein
MKFVFCLLLLSAVTAWAQDFGASNLSKKKSTKPDPIPVEYPTSKWQSPKPNDKRSPCPMLNALANEGLLNRDGTGISVDQLVTVLHQHLKMDHYTAITLASSLRDVMKKGESTISLDQLNLHQMLEHDASLTRPDHAPPRGLFSKKNEYVGDSSKFSPFLYSQIDQFTDKSDNIATLSFMGLARFRHLRETQSREHNSKFFFGFPQRLLAYGESALLYHYFKENDKIRMDWLDMFFKEEKLPYELKWAPKESLTLNTLFEYGTALQFQVGMIDQINSVNAANVESSVVPAADPATRAPVNVSEVPAAAPAA